MSLQNTVITAILLTIALPCQAIAHGGGRSRGGYHAPRSSGGFHIRGEHSPRVHIARERAFSGIARDSHGRIQRSQSAKNDFKRGTPCPSTGRRGGPCPGYVIDHVQALKHGGADAPHNMQWQTKEAAKAKDKWE